MYEGKNTYPRNNGHFRQKLSKCVWEKVIISFTYIFRMKQLEISIAKKRKNKRVKRSRIYFKGVNDSYFGSFRIIPPIHIQGSIITFIFTVVTEVLKR